jgi:PAS domain S-box-containing protein
MLQVSSNRVQSWTSAKVSPLQRSFAIGLAVITGVAYFLAARLSLFLLTQPDGVAVFWPAAGVSSGILIAFGRNARWPVAAGVIAATIAANLTSDRTIWASIAFALCDAGEALLTAWVIERVIGPNFSLDSLRHVIWLLVGATIGTGSAGVAAAVAYKLLHSPDTPMLTTWQHWFLSDAMGIITTAPLMIGIGSAFRASLTRREFIEGSSILIAVAGAMAIIIFVLPRYWFGESIPVGLLYPLVLWSSARCRSAFTAAAVFIISLAVAGAIIFKLGHFADLGFFADLGLPMDQYIFSAQADLLGLAIFAYVLAALFAERRQHEVAISGSENRMRAVVNTVVEGIITIDDRGTIENLNLSAARLFGYNPEEIIGRNVKLLMPEPYHSEHDRYLSNYLSTGQAKVIGLGREVMGRRKDGSIFPLELAVSEMRVAESRMFTGVVRDITERKQAEDRNRILVAELDHRVKNILALVAAVATSTRKGSRSIDDFLQSLDGRIQSMAAAHTLLSKSSWQGVGLGALVQNQLAPYVTGDNISINGSNIMLGSAETQAIARVLHELATNAAKYGALSIPSGHVSVSWNCTANGYVETLIFVWRELGGPPVSSKVQSNYGTNLIRNLIPHELGGAVDLVFATEGVNCRIEIPIKAV